MQHARPKLLVVGDAVVTTGFSRLIRSVFAQLATSFEIHQLAISYNGDPHDYPWPLYPAGSRGDLYGVNRISHLIDSIKPDLVLIVNDVWLVGDYLDVIVEENIKIPVVAYCPIEAYGVGVDVLSKLLKLTKLVLYTQFGKTEVARTFLKNGYQEQTLSDFLAVIPHGVDKENFFPLADTYDRNEVKQSLLGCDAKDSFIVFNGNRNQPRKRIDATIRGFSLFSRGKPESVKLYLHMGTKDLGWDILELCKRYDIQDRLIITSNTRSLPSVSTKQLNLIYNACDVGVNTSSAEGWGLVSFEHGATNRAQIVPNHSSCAELWKDSGLLLEPRLSTISPETMLEEKLVDEQELCEALTLLYEDEERRKELGQAAYDNATRAEYSWENIADKWRQLIESVL